MDIKTTFINGQLLEEVYMFQLDGFEIKGKDYTYRLKKSLYGVKQASREWFFRFDEVVTSFSFEENTLDQCILKYMLMIFCLLVLVLVTL